MPITKSAKKAVKQTIKKKSRNDHFKSLYREARVSFEKAIKSSQVDLAKSVFFNEKNKDWNTSKAWLQSIIDKLVKKNIIHINTASRRKSKFSKMLKILETSKK